MIASFNRFELVLTKSQAKSASHQGQCQEDVEALLLEPRIRRQLDKIPPATIAAELKECGAWDEVELQDHQQNRARIVWIAAGNINEEIREAKR